MRSGSKLPCHTVNTGPADVGKGRGDRFCACHFKLRSYPTHSMMSVSILEMIQDIVGNFIKMLF